MLWGIITIPHLIIFGLGFAVGALGVLNNYLKAKALKDKLQTEINELKAKVK